MLKKKRKKKSKRKKTHEPSLHEKGGRFIVYVDVDIDGRYVNV